MGVLALTGCDNTASVSLPRVAQADRVVITNATIHNNEATVPPMCYTKTEQQHNPCYVCHQAYSDNIPTSNNPHYRYNQLSDFGLQGTYRFSDIGINNQWHNLFVDREDWVNTISDETILAYVNQDNYSALPPRLQKNDWQGFIPDLKHYHLGKAAFDDKGLAKDESYWVAYNYKPLPSTFWPTNGSTDDVLIRLPAAFREIQGQFHRGVYFANLSLLEMSIKQLPQIDIPPFNERIAQLDINNDGKLSEQVTQLSFQSHFLGDAYDVAVLPQQFPQGTEIMHSVRYLGINEGEEVVMSTRMKELRYMKKFRELTKSDIDNRYRRERKEKVEEELPTFTYHFDKGFENGYGWHLQAFIEDYDGELRPQTFEETMFCMGCHSAIGTTIDHTFSFARKVTGAKGWGFIDLRGMVDAPNISEPGGEIINYLTRVNGGHEFRENPEMQSKWFDKKGNLKAETYEQDVYLLITPSKERALQLNKAYTHIVRHQSYKYGRDPNVRPMMNVHQTVDESTAPLAHPHRVMNWDIRLDWSQSSTLTHGHWAQKMDETLLK